MAHQGYPVYDIAGLATLRTDVLVQPFGPYIMQHHKLHAPHRHAFYHLVYFTTGGGHHTIDFDRFDVRPFQLYAMVPGQVHHWDFHGDVDGYVLNFSASFFQPFLLRPDYIDELPFFQGLAQQAVMDIPESLRQRIQWIFEEMVSLDGSLHPFHIDKLRVLMLQLFLELAGMQTLETTATRSYQATVVRNFRKLVDQHFIEWRLPRDYAALLHVSPSHLNAVCSEWLGQSAGELIRNRVTLEAKRLLINPALSVAEVAYMLNFEDNSYFTKFFKKNAGIAPEAFRKSVLR